MKRIKRATSPPIIKIVVVEVVMAAFIVIALFLLITQGLQEFVLSFVIFAFICTIASAIAS